MTACSTGNHYTVKLNDERHTCRCVDFCCRGRQRPCKHLTLVMQQLNITSDDPKGWHQVRHIKSCHFSLTLVMQQLAMTGMTTMIGIRCRVLRSLSHLRFLLVVQRVDKMHNRPKGLHQVRLEPVT